MLAAVLLLRGAAEIVPPTVVPGAVPVDLALASGGDGEPVDAPAMPVAPPASNPPPPPDVPPSRTAEEAERTPDAPARALVLPQVAAASAPLSMPSHSTASQPKREAAVIQSAARFSTGRRPFASQHHDTITAEVARSAGPMPMAAASSGTTRLTAPRFRRTPSSPDYRARAVQVDITGTVVVRALLGAGGDSLEARVHRSSGNPLLDGAAVAAVRRWAIVPASVDGRRTEAWVEVPVRFRLK